VVRIHTDECVQYHFQIPPDAQSWAARLEAACRYLESHPALPPLPLAYGLKTRDNTQFELDDRAAFLGRSLRTPHRKFCVVNSRQRRVVGLDVIDEGVVIVRNGNTQPPDIFGLFVQVPTIAPGLRLELLANLGDILQAHSGLHMTQAAWWLLHNWADEKRRQRRDAPEPLVVRPLRELLAREGLDLPLLETNQGKFESPWQPELAGWINYWSEETARYIGFPDTTRDRDLLNIASRTPKGAWLLQLTPGPLDLMDPAHLGAYVDLLNRMPRLGIRQ